MQLTRRQVKAINTLAQESYEKEKEKMPKFGFGDIVKIRNEKTLGKVECEIIDEDGSIWYEVKPIGIDTDYTREIKESDLRPA